MRKFKVLVELEVHATSFEKAESEVHKTLCDGWNVSEGKRHLRFDCLKITKGKKVK